MVLITPRRFFRIDLTNISIKLFSYSEKMSVFLFNVNNDFMFSLSTRELCEKYTDSHLGIFPSEPNISRNIIYLGIRGNLLET